MEKHSDQSPASMVSTEEKNESNAGRLHVPHYSEQEAQVLEERLVNEETFREAQQILITWLERGECTKTNSAHFYSLIHLCSNLLEKLLTQEKEHLEEAVGESLLNVSCDIRNAVEEVFNVIEKRDIWGNFTRNQMENLQKIRANILDQKQNISTDVNVNYEREEVEENPKFLLEKVDILTNELNAANQVKEDLITKCQENEDEILKLRSELQKSKEMHNLEDESWNKKMNITSHVAIFLKGYPEGVNIDRISSHLKSVSKISTHAGEIENVMRNDPKTFKESSPIGATQEKRWTLIISPEASKTLQSLNLN